MRRIALPLSTPRDPRRGGLSIGLVIVLALVAGLVIAGVVLFGSYNALARNKEDVASKFAALDATYKRRADLIPQLVEVVKGAADFEKSTLDAVVSARAAATQTRLPADALSDPAALQRYMEAQNQLGGALSRLLVVVEKYPELRATQNFLSLQDQVEGTENRIQVARRDVIESVQAFNTRTATFPSNFVAGMFGFERLPQLESTTAEERAAPKIDFGAGGAAK
ncbi:MAG: LemA family protein [Planctomycetes bacterium]|nr:LemA family protein [Planctomycetota bacterium]